MPNNTEATPKITLQKVTLIIVVLLIAVISFTKVSNWAADPATHTHSITQTNDKIKTVMTLSGGAAGASGIKKSSGKYKHQHQRDTGDDIRIGHGDIGHGIQRTFHPF